MSQPSLVLSQEAIRRAVTRMAHQIVETNTSGEDVVVIGVQRGGILLSRRIASELEKIWKHPVPCGAVDVNMHRDDLDQRSAPEVHPTEIPFDLNDKTVLLVDDVLFSGRTTRAAMDALTAFGRPKRIQLAALIDRGHRELPIMPDFVGKKITTTPDQHVLVQLNEKGESESVLIKTP